MFKRVVSVLLVTSPVMANESDVHLVAIMQLGGSNLAQSIFLHDPQIKTLEQCQEAVRVGQRDRDWPYYRHFLNRERFQGFTAELDYRCVRSPQRFSSWNDRLRYKQPYLIGIDAQSTMTIEQLATQAQCASVLASLPAEQRAQSRCALGNQTLR